MEGKRGIAIVLCVMLLLFTASGCRISDALTEVVYDQTADVIDYDNPSKVYINDSTAEVESDQVSAKEVSDDSTRISGTVQNLVVYGSDPNTQGFTAKKSAFSPTPDFEGIEASEEVTFVQSEDPDAFNHAPTIEEVEPEPEQEPEQQEQQVVASSDAEPTDTDATPTQSGESSKKGPSEEPATNEDPQDNDGQDDGDDGDGQDDGDGSDPQPEQEENNPGGNDKGEVPVAYDSTDPTAEPAKVSKIAAYGPAATIVQMIGGTGALAAADASTLGGNFSKVFDTASVTAGWAGDGTDAATLDVDAVIASGANTILVYSGNYLADALPAESVDRLTKAGVTQSVIYPLTNSANIKQDVTVIGKMLSDATDIQYAGQTASRADSYVAFHDGVVSSAANANGGLAGSRVYQSGSDGSAPGFASGTPTYTLVIDAYEDSAYTGAALGSWKPSNGLAFATGGYNTSPFSYYIQAGGLINNAADKTILDDSGATVAWQFHVNNFPFRAGEWVGSIAERARTVTGYSLLTTTNNLHGIYPFGQSFGSTSFPKVIVTSRTIESSLIANSKNANGTFHPYSFVSDGVYNIMGPAPSVPSCIGFNGADPYQAGNLFTTGQVSDDDIVVNPSGLFCSWQDGTVESFLEAAWVSDVANGSGSPVGWQQLVNDFYERFYGYSLTSADWSSMDPEDY